VPRVFIDKPLEEIFENVSFGLNVQVIGIANVTIGQGSCISDNVWLNVCIRDGSTIRMKIGQCTLVGRNSMISTAGYLEIGDYCLLAPNVYISDADHIYADIKQPIMQQGATEGRTVIIEDNCWFGINSVITGNLTIGRGSVVAANSVVNRDVPPFSVVAGSPAAIIKLYNPKSNEWEKIKSENDLIRIESGREEHGIPTKDEYKVILKENSKVKRLDPILSGRGLNI
jgi:acetyltransferase-like isoleucine patch superfamily enzyme